MNELIMGLDLGQTKDYSVLSILEKEKRHPTGTAPDLLAMSSMVGHYAVRYLKRWQLGTAYPQIVRDVSMMCNRPPLLRSGSSLVVDATGVGRPVVDMFREADLSTSRLVPVTITFGHSVTLQGDGFHVAKKHLVSAMLVLMQQGQLKVSSLSERENLVKELRAFRIKMKSASMAESFEALTEKDHDDMVTSIALACWWGERESKKKVQFRVYRNADKKGKGPHQRIVVCTHDELAGTVFDERVLLICFADPENDGGVGDERGGGADREQARVGQHAEPPRNFNGEQDGDGELSGYDGMRNGVGMGGTTFPSHGCNNLLDSLTVRCADLDPQEAQDRWNEPIPPWGKTPPELILQRDDAKRVWKMILAARDPRWEILVVSDTDDRRALSAALAICDVLRFDRDAAVQVLSDAENVKWSEAVAPNGHVYALVKEGRASIL